MHLLRVPCNLAQIRIMKYVYHTIQYITEASTIEACGSLYGFVSTSTITIAHSRACHNYEQSNMDFSLNIAELFDPPNGLANQEGLLGIYHSHVNEPAQLSYVDRYYLSLSKWLWLVTGKSRDTNNFEMRCFARFKSLTKEIPYLIVDEEHTKGNP